MNITRGKIKSAIKMLVYGPEGVGKTTFAAKAPGAVFIDTEGSTRHMDVSRFDPPAVLSDVMDAINYTLGHPGEIQTLVIDTVDWMEKLIFDSVCIEKKVQNIEDIGYGKGYVYAKQKMQQILDVLQAIINNGTHVVLVCHSIIRKFEQPDEMGSYDRYMLKLNEKNIAPLVKEWVDLMLFVNYRADIVKTDEKVRKGTGGKKRIMYATHTACWDAKNRFGLPDEMPFEFEKIAELFGNTEQLTQAPKKQQSMEDVLNTQPIDLPEASAEVDILARLPEEKPKKGKKTNQPPEQPASMHSDNPEKDKLLTELWNRMVGQNVFNPMLIQAVCAEKGYYDADVPVNEYDMDFIDGCLLEAWDTVLKLVQTKQYNLPF